MPLHAHVTILYIWPNCSSVCCSPLHRTRPAEARFLQRMLGISPCPAQASWSHKYFPPPATCSNLLPRRTMPVAFPMHKPRATAMQAKLLAPVHLARQRLSRNPVRCLSRYLCKLSVSLHFTSYSSSSHTPSNPIQCYHTSAIFCNARPHCSHAKDVTNQDPTLFRCSMSRTSSNWLPQVTSACMSSAQEPREHKFEFGAIKASEINEQRVGYLESRRVLKREKKRKVLGGVFIF